MLKFTLGVEAFEGKVVEDFGPINAQVFNDPHARELPVLDPVAWVRDLVARKARELGSMDIPLHVPPNPHLGHSEVLKKWLLNGELGLFNQAETDVVLDAMVRSPVAPVDPTETDQRRRDRDQELAVTRARVTARRAQLPP